MSFCVAFVHNEQVHAQWAISLAELRARLDCSMIGVYSGSRVDHGRNVAVRGFLDDPAKGDWLLFVDTDIVFTPEDVRSLFATAEREQSPVVGGLYFDIGGDAVARVREADNADGGMNHRLLTDAETYGPPMAVDALGAGFLLVHREVLDHVGRDWKNTGRPWFAFSEHFGTAYSEDIEFCIRVRELGYPIWLDTAARVGHRKGATL